MYYPAGFIYYYSLLYSFTGDSLAAVPNVHVVVNVLITVGYCHLFAPYLGKYSKWSMLAIPILAQNIYRAGISRVTNDLHLVAVYILMMLALQRKKFGLVSLLYSCAVAYKMNALFFGPPLLFTYLCCLPLKRVVLHFGGMAIFQAVLPLPFWLTDASHYAKIAYNFSRDFEPPYNMAWGFLSDAWRTSPIFYKFLLLLTLFFLAALYYPLVIRALRQSKASRSTSNNSQITFSAMELFLQTFVATNFVCYVFTRGIHMQFFLWISWSIPYLLMRCCQMNPVLSILLYVVLDWCHSWVANVVILPELFSLTPLQAFTQLQGVPWTAANADTLTILGGYYNQGWSLSVWPASFLLFSAECIILWRLYAVLYRSAVVDTEGKGMTAI